MDYRVLYPCNLLLYPCDFPGKNTGVGCHFLLERIFPTQGSNARLLHLLHWRVDSLPLSRLGSPSTTQYSVINFSYHVVIRSSDHIHFETEIFYPLPSSISLHPSLIIYTMQHLSSVWLISLSIMPSSFTDVVPKSRIFFFLRLNNIPLYACTTFSLSILLSTNMKIVSMPWLLWIMSYHLLELKFR